ncbi:MAG: UDP-N-acetylmuramate dehydrogenase [Erysipelotrichaceae bacterium]
MEWLKQLKKYGDVEEQASFAKRTSFHVGGSIAYVIHPYHAEKLAELMGFLNANNIPHKVLGRGSNLLCSDAPYEGVVISLERYFHGHTIKEHEMIVGAGASLIATSFQAMEAGLSGMEFASGIPGTIGGAIFMNAGAYNSDMAAITTQVQLYRDGKIEWVEASQLAFRYRYSILKEKDWVVLAVKLHFTPKDPADILALMNSRKERRMIAQPYSAKSAGSTFKNPEGHAAWKLIEDLHYRGKRVGGAQVSEKHCNFIINADNASATDLRTLMEEIQHAVYDAYHVELQLEVELFNWDDTH